MFVKTSHFKRPRLAFYYEKVFAFISYGNIRPIRNDIYTELSLSLSFKTPKRWGICVFFDFKIAKFVVFGIWVLS